MNITKPPFSFNLSKSFVRSISRFTTTLATTLLAATSISVHAESKTEQAIEYRQSVFIIQAKAFREISAMNKGDVPFNAANVQANAHIISTLSTLPWAAFAEGTASRKTKPAIWSDAAGFKAASNQYVAAAAKLEAAAKTGDAAQVKTATGALGATCKQCHDAFRK